MSPTDYPKLAKAPVVETILGVEFEHLEGWRTPHFGVFWELVKSEFPKFDDQTPLESQIEGFGKPVKRVGPVFQVLSRPEVRCWFIDDTRNVLLQIQNGRFLQNWRKTSGAATYPHYATTRAGFARDWDRFAGFVKDQDLGEPNVRQCEVSYINHLEAGNGWNSFADLGSVIPAIGQLFGGPLPIADGFRVSSRYELPDQRGRLYVDMQTAIRDSDGEQILVFTLTARGAPPSPKTADILAWFDFGRDRVHTAFNYFTSEAVRSLWRGKEPTI